MGSFKGVADLMCYWVEGFSRRDMAEHGGAVAKVRFSSWVGWNERRRKVEMERKGPEGG